MSGGKLTNSKENRHQRPYGLNTIVEILVLFWLFWLLVQSIGAYYFADTMTFDGVTIDEILLLYIRYAKLLVGIMIFPVVYTILKGKSWSWTILKTVFTVLIGLIGIEIIASFVFYEHIETGLIFYNLPPITLLLLIIYYFTRTHVKQYLLQRFFL